MDFPAKHLISRLGIRPRKHRSQHFLVDKNSARIAVDAASIAPGDTVIEIGPGLGALTCIILQQGASAIAFDIDRDMCRILQGRAEESDNLTVYNRDILSISFSDYAPRPAVLMGSIPYAITTPIVLKSLKEARCVQRAVFIMQQECAARICASPGTGDYGSLSVLCRAYAGAATAHTIAPSCFYPQPRVQSAVLTLTPRSDRQWHDAGEELFRDVVKAAFSQRRKTARNCLKGILSRYGIGYNEFRDRAAQEHIDIAQRAETFSLEAFDTLTDIIRDMRS